MSLKSLIPLFLPRSKAQIEIVTEALGTFSVSQIEVVLRSDIALSAIEYMAKNINIRILAGTVTTVEQAQRSIEAGAIQIVSPGFSAKVADWCRCNDIAYIPGVATASEVLLASVEHGLNQLKQFPANMIGGVAWLNAMSAPYTNVSFMPTGGIDENNLQEYLACPNVFAVGGTFLLPNKIESITQVSNHLKHFYSL